MENSCLKRIFFNVGLGGAVLFLQGCVDSPDCASNSAKTALVDNFKANPQNELFQSIPLHVPFILNSAAQHGAADTFTDELCADYKRLCAIAAERNHIIDEISERKSGAGQVNSCDAHNDFLQAIASEMDQELAVYERRKLNQFQTQEKQYQAWKAGGYQPVGGTPKQQAYVGGVTPTGRTRSGGGDAAPRGVTETNNVEHPSPVVNNNENGCLDINQLSRKADMLSVYLEHDVEQARVSDVQKHGKALSNGTFEFDNIVTEEKNAQTNAVACRADVKLSVKGWGEAQAKISYRVEKASNGKIIVTATGID